MHLHQSPEILDKILHFQKSNNCKGSCNEVQNEGNEQGQFLEEGRMSMKFFQVWTSLVEFQSDAGW